MYGVLPLFYPMVPGDRIILKQVFIFSINIKQINLTPEFILLHFKALILMQSTPPNYLKMLILLILYTMARPLLYYLLKAGTGSLILTKALGERATTPQKR